MKNIWIKKKKKYKIKKFTIENNFFKYKNILKIKIKIKYKDVKNKKKNHKNKMK